MKNLLRRSVFYRLYKNLKARIASIFYGNPSKELFIIGVTGTDGKTTTSSILYEILNKVYGNTALITNNVIKFGEQEPIFDLDRGRFDSWFLQKMLFYLKVRSCKYVIVEVDSLGLAEYDFFGIDFDMGILTNLFQDHIDYHKDVNTYYKVKKSFFDSIVLNSKKIKYCVFPNDINMARKWNEEMVFDNVISFGIMTTAVVKGEVLEQDFNGSSFVVKYLNQVVNFETSLLGKYNIYNILGAVSAGLLLGIQLEDLASVIKSTNIEIDSTSKIEGGGLRILIDRINSPSALESVLRYLNDIKGKGRLICLIGAEGNSDKYKRALLGSTAEKFADVIIVSDDDPKTENRYSIINEITAGIRRKEGNNYYILAEREMAFKMIFQIAENGDYIFILGKKIPNFQYTNFGYRKWDDNEKITEFLKEIGNNEK